MPEEAKPRITLLYLGCRSGKPLQHLWFDLTGIENDGSPLQDEPGRHQFYGSKKKGHSTRNIAFAQPGAIYSFEKSEGGVYGSTANYQGRWKNEEDVLKWTAEHNAIDRAAELAAQAVKENKEHLDWEASEPFRKAYNGRLNYRQQQMLLAQVMQYVTRHKGADDE
jgi:hypothetical protein